MTKVNDATVERMIAGVRDYIATELGTESPGPVDISFEAWILLRDKRRTDEYQANFDVAAAEHYMYARYLAGLTGDPITQLAPRIYALKKRAYFALGKEPALRTDPARPTLPYDERIELWGIKGAQAGLVDFGAAHPGTSPPIGASVESLLSDAGISPEKAKSAGNYAVKIGSRFGRLAGHGG